MLMSSRLERVLSWRSKGKEKGRQKQTINKHCDMHRTSPLFDGDIQAWFRISNNRGKWIHKEKGRDSVLPSAKQVDRCHSVNIQIQPPLDLGSLPLLPPSFLKISQLLLLSGRLTWRRWWSGAA
jgi:hypothetical protein